MNLPFIDWIWRVKGSLALDARQSPADAFDRLDPLFQAAGTSHSIDGDTLTFSKKNSLAQDKMSVFDHGVLKVENGAAGPVLNYTLISRPLLACFLAPLLFLAFSQITVFVGKLQKPETEEADKSKKDKEKDKVVKLNPIDEFLGAPAPETPKEKEAKEKKAKKDKEKDKNKGPSPTPAYVFAGIFATLYLAGRLLEPWLIKKEFRRRLKGDPLPDGETPLANH